MSDIKLEGFCYANGVHWCDTNIYNNGYYKRLALVTNSGIVKWDVDKDKLPQDIINHIESDGERTKYRFMKEWNSLKEIDKFTRIIDSLTISELISIKRDTPAGEIIKMFKQSYFEKC